MCVIHQDAVIVVLTLNFHTVKKSKVIAKAGKSGAFFICTSCYKHRKKLPPFLLLFWFNTGCLKKTNTTQRSVGSLGYRFVHEVTKKEHCHVCVFLIFSSSIR